MTLIGAVLLVAVSVVGSAAFTSAQLDRSANVDVVNDANGLLGLEATPNSGTVTENASGALQIDFATNNATGVNPSATFSVGDAADPVNSYAFTLTNRDTAARDVTLAYAAAAPGNSAITFRVFRDDGTTEAATIRNDGSATVSVSAGETLYVVVELDTDSDADDLSGTLTISA